MIYALGHTLLTEVIPGVIIGFCIIAVPVALWRLAKWIYDSQN